MVCRSHQCTRDGPFSFFWRVCLPQQHHRRRCLLHPRDQPEGQEGSHCKGADERGTQSNPGEPVPGRGWNYLSRNGSFGLADSSCFRFQGNGCATFTGRGYCISAQLCRIAFAGGQVACCWECRERFIESGFFLHEHSGNDAQIVVHAEDACQHTDN